EAGERRLDGVEPGTQLRRERAAVGTPDHLAEETGPLVGDDDAAAGQHAALVVAAAPANFRSALLSGDARGERHEEGKHPANQTSSHLRPPYVEPDVGERRVADKRKSSAEIKQFVRTGRNRI